MPSAISDRKPGQTRQKGKIDFWRVDLNTTRSHQQTPRSAIAPSFQHARNAAAAEALLFLDSEISEQAQAKAVFEDEQQRVANQDSTERIMPPPKDDADATAEGAKMPAQPTAKVSKSAISVINENGKLGSIHFRTEMGSPPHQPTFVVEAVMGSNAIGTGQATTKKKAK